MAKFIDLTGQRFGRLEVLKRAENDKYGNSRWLCECDCKRKVIAQGGHLRIGDTKSCGCLAKNNALKHGHYQKGKTAREYQSWLNMKQRCTNPNHKYWKDYGGRKIKVCKRWLGENGFIHFLEDMGECPPGYTLERRENEEGYHPDNCYWATREQQARNRRNNRRVTYKGKRWLFVELCEEYNMPRGIVYARYYRCGWTLEEALTTPMGEKRKRDG